MNDKMEHGQDTVDQRLSVALMPSLSVFAEQASYLSDQVDRMRSDPEEANDALEGVLTRQFAVQAQVAERLEQIIQALAAGNLFFVKEGALVHAIADRLATTWNTANTVDKDGEALATKEGYIRVSQLFLSDLKDKGVIL